MTNYRTAGKSQQIGDDSLCFAKQNIEKGSRFFLLPYHLLYREQTFSLIRILSDPALFPAVSFADAFPAAPRA